MIDENFSFADLDLTLVSQETLDSVLKKSEEMYISHAVDSELNKYLMEQTEVFIQEEENEDAKKELENTKEHHRQKRLAHIKMITQSAESIKNIKTLISNK